VPTDTGANLQAQCAQALRDHTRRTLLATGDFRMLVEVAAQLDHCCAIALDGR